MAYSAGPVSFGSEEETAAFAARLAARLGPGDTVLLSGEIGAGKSALARALIRARLGDPVAEVPSPTFTLVQTYRAPDVEIWHADLYRLGDADEVRELGLEAAFDTAICLVEWPDRLNGLTPPEALLIRMAAGPDAHEVRLSGPSSWTDRLEAILA